MNIVDEICELFATKGHAAYIGEPVSQLEHALQSAYHAEQAGADDELVVAALLHDVGHLITKLPEDAPNRASTIGTKQLGQAWLKRHSQPAVRSRYGCTWRRSAICRDRSGLPAAAFAGFANEPQAARRTVHAGGSRGVRSQPTLSPGGGSRRWDDLAKVPGMQVPALDHYRPRMGACCTMAG